MVDLKLTVSIHRIVWEGFIKLVADERVRRSV